MTSKHKLFRFRIFIFCLLAFAGLFSVFIWPKTDMAKNRYYQTNYPFFAFPKGFQEEVIFRTEGREPSGFSLLHYKGEEVENWTPEHLDPKVQPVSPEEFVTQVVETPFLRDHKEKIQPILNPQIEKDPHPGCYQYQKDGNAYFLYVPSNENTLYFLYRVQ
ncbi:hypothetical protein [Aedoeadaptatus coxii]|uniref:hypothetical protein n=1 Tax=Aedoeadaptatus coxii TaxID=755172 RepID=UPI002AD1EBAB|nr:hypothetical protein [Peptoniphilus coxii]